jgi:uncharacterized membrane protein
MLSFVVFFTFLSTVAAGIYTDDATEQKKIWDGFKKDFGRDYATMDEENRRFQIFLKT